MFHVKHVRTVNHLNLENKSRSQPERFDNFFDKFKSVQSNDRYSGYVSRETLIAIEAAVLLKTLGHRAGVVHSHVEGGIWDNSQKL